VYRGQSLARTDQLRETDHIPEVLLKDYQRLLGRGLHLSTFQLNSSALYGIGGSRRGLVARGKGVSGGV